jgi:hypothetical protein
LPYPAKSVLQIEIHIILESRIGRDPDQIHVKVKSHSGFQIRIEEKSQELTLTPWSGGSVGHY